MYYIRDYVESDIEFVQAINYILSLQIQYCGDFSKENIITVVDEEKQIKGVAVLGYHNTWYGDNSENVHKVVFEYCNVEGERQVLDYLIQGMNEKLEHLKQQEPNKNVQVITFVEEKDLDETQELLRNGFCYGAVIPVLAYDLTKDITHYEMPEGVSIEKVGRDDDSITDYIRSTGIANQGVTDSKAEYLFRSFDESFDSYRAIYNGNTVGGISIWNIGEERGATENIFTIPEFRRKNIARELIATGFEDLKKRGLKLATLSLDGGNVNAMKLYQSIGYELFYYLLELKYV